MLSKPYTPRSLPPWLLDILACPRCGGTLTLSEQMLRCTGCGQPYPSHPHLDLLAPGKRPANEGPGDTAAMARQRMAWERHMEAEPLGELAALQRYLALVAPRLRSGAVAVDLGCGTGADLRALGQRVSGPLGFLGLDIALPMIDASYRVLRDEPRAYTARASTRRRLPLRDSTVDAVLRRLAPALPDEVLRVLKPGGAFLTFSFGPAHWREAYDALPELPRPRAERDDARDTLTAQGFTSVEQHVWRGDETLPPKRVLERLLIGPAAFRVNPARDLPLLHNLAERQGTPRLVSLTTEIVVTVGLKPVAAA